jgi:opacity protein-like surface antigen
MKRQINRLRPLIYSCIFPVAIIMSCIDCPAAFAAQSSPTLAKKQAYTPGYLEVIAAGNLSNVNTRNSTIAVTRSETDKLVQTNQNAWNSWGGQFGVGYVYFLGQAVEFSQATQWFPKFESEVTVNANKFNNSGDVWRFKNPAWNQLTYNMPIYSTRLMLDGALTVISRAETSAYVIGGVGNSWNRINYGDNANPGPGCTNASISLDKNSRSHFVWEVGAGLAYVISGRSNLFLEYLYSDYGTLSASGGGHSGPITAPTLSAKLNLQTQGVFLGVHVAI